MKLCLYIILICLAASCGTRKKVVELQKLRIDQQKEIILKLQNDITSNITVWSKQNRIELTPINPDLESLYDGKPFKNTKVTIEQKESDSTAITKDLSTSELSDKSSTKINAKDKVLDLKTKKPNPWLWLGVVVVVCFGIWVFVKKDI